MCIRDSNYVKAYAELYDEIVKGYENGTREIYVADENGPRKLTKDEELSNLDAVSYTHLDVYKRQYQYSVGTQSDKYVHGDNKECRKAVFRY